MKDTTDKWDPDKFCELGMLAESLVQLGGVWPLAAYSDPRICLAACRQMGVRAEHIAACSKFGDEKYGPYTWRDVSPFDLLAAQRRHMLAGEGLDPESGCPHRWHAAWNAIAQICLESK